MLLMSPPVPCCVALDMPALTCCCTALTAMSLLCAPCHVRRVQPTVLRGLEAQPQAATIPPANAVRIDMSAGTGSDCRNVACVLSWLQAKDLLRARPPSCILSSFASLATLHQLTSTLLLTHACSAVLPRELQHLQCPRHSDCMRDMPRWLPSTSKRTVQQ